MDILEKIPENATEIEKDLLAEVFQAYPFTTENLYKLRRLSIKILDDNMPFKPHIEDWDKVMEKFDEEPLPGGAYLHRQHLLLLRRPLDHHLVAHEYAHAIDQALDYPSNSEHFKHLYTSGKKAISPDAYFSTTEWFAENLAAQAGWTQNGLVGEDSRRLLRETEPHAVDAFIDLMQNQRVKKISR